MLWWHLLLFEFFFDNLRAVNHLASPLNNIVVLDQVVKLCGKLGCAIKLALNEQLGTHDLLINLVKYQVFAFLFRRGVLREQQLQFLR
jgi:hypothetical protein